MTALGRRRGRTVGDQHHPPAAEPLDLGADLGKPTGAEHDAGRQLVVGERVHAACRAAQRVELVVGRLVGRRQVVGEANGPPGGRDDLLAGDAGVQGDDDELAGVGVRLHHRQVGDDPLRAAAAQAEPLAITLAVAEADRGAEVAALDERPRRSDA